MIQIQGLTKFYGDFCAVDDISFEIRKGEILGLLGPNGAGKTTTLRILTCYLAPTKGTIKVKNLNIQDHPLEIKQLIGYLPESAPLYSDMLVYDYLQYVADIRGVEKNKRDARIGELADMCGLYGIMHKAVGELSKGLKQRVGLAHAMIGDPEILVLDEPTSGLDPNQIVEIRELIKRIGKDKTIILSSHILSEVEATCGRVVIINRGKIAADGALSDLKRSAALQSHISLKLSNANIKDVRAVLSRIGGVADVTETGREGDILNVNVTAESAGDVRPTVYLAVKSTDWVLLEFAGQTATLEAIFRDLTIKEK